MTNIALRQVTQNDAGFLQRLMNDEQIMAILHEAPTSVDAWADAIAEWGNDPDEEDYIITDDGMSIGWLGVNGLSSERKHAFIKVIALLPAHQGHGIGQYVLNEAMGNLRLRGLASLGLYTDCCNERAQHCYSECGFHISEETVQRMSDGVLVERYKMECSLQDSL